MTRSPYRMPNSTVSSNEFSTQWTHPADVFSVLLLLGGDVVARALAQLVGGWITPVAFSFGRSNSLNGLFQGVIYLVLFHEKLSAINELVKNK